MTYCNTLFEPLIRRIEIEKKTLDEIADEVCGDTVKNPRQKIIRIIKVLLGEEYLIEHAQTLGYNTVKAVRQKSTDEVVIRKIVTEVEDSDNSGQTNSVTPISPCQTILQANTEHEDEAGQTKGEKILEEHDKPAACCQKQAVRKVRKTDSDINEDESGETKEQVVEENDDAPAVNLPHELIEEIIILIKKYSFEDVKKAIDSYQKQYLTEGY